MPRARSEVPRPFALMTAARSRLGDSQAQFAARFGLSAKTIARLERGKATLTPEMLSQASRLVVGEDRELARQLAREAGVEVPAGTSAAPAAVTRSPTREHLADSVVCAAASAMGSPPEPVRSALHAACVRAKAMGLSLDDLDQALAKSADPR